MQLNNAAEVSQGHLIPESWLWNPAPVHGDCVSSRAIYLWFPQTSEEVWEYIQVCAYLIGKKKIFLKIRHKWHQKQLMFLKVSMLRNWAENILGSPEQLCLWDVRELWFSDKARVESSFPDFHWWENISLELWKWALNCLAVCCSAIFCFQSRYKEQSSTTTQTNLLGSTHHGGECGSNKGNAPSQAWMGSKRTCLVKFLLFFLFGVNQ